MLPLLWPLVARRKSPLLHPHPLLWLLPLLHLLKLLLPLPPPLQPKLLPLLVLPWVRLLAPWLALLLMLPTLLATLPRLPLTLPRPLLKPLPRSNLTARVHPAVDTKSHRKVAFLLAER